MSIWDEPSTKDEYSRRLFELKADRRRQDAQLPFEENVEIVLALQDASRALRGASAIEPPVFFDPAGTGSLRTEIAILATSHTTSLSEDR